MMVCSFRLNKKVILFVLIALIALAVLLLLILSKSPKMPAESGAINNAAATPEERMSFIRQFGWEAESEPAETLDIYIPADFDAVLNRYNAIQINQGYDLSAYKGMNVQRYSYKLTNYPDFDGDVFLNMLVSGGKVIGGDICSKNLGGFIHGFSPNRTEVSGAAESTGVSLPEDAQSAAAVSEVSAAAMSEVSGPSD